MPEIFTVDSIRLDNPKIQQTISAQQFPLLFVTMSGSDLYGFVSSDSDYDMRGCHVLPTQDMLSLGHTKDTIEHMDDRHEIDIVTHDVSKYFGLLLKKNGYVLEQVYSPIVLHTTPEHDDLKKIAMRTITRYHWRHYNGFANNEIKLIKSHPERRVKRFLYLYRIYLTGIYLMQSGIIESNLSSLLEDVRVSDAIRVHANYLVERKALGFEGITMQDDECEPFWRDVAILNAMLELEGGRSTLPEIETARGDLNDLLLRVRKNYGREF